MKVQCYFAQLGGCQGRLVKAHLIPKQRLKRELRQHSHDDLVNICWDPRVWVWMCGGVTGIGGHHGAFDAKQIRIARRDLPLPVEEFAREHDLMWSLERDYPDATRGDYA